MQFCFFFHKNFLKCLVVTTFISFVYKKNNLTLKSFCLIDSILQVTNVVYHFLNRPIGLSDILLNLKNILVFAKKSVKLTCSFVLNSVKVSDFIESKVVEIIDSQVKSFLFKLIFL